MSKTGARPRLARKVVEHGPWYGLMVVPTTTAAASEFGMNLGQTVRSAT
jgi:hypothetical protein